MPGQEVHSFHLLVACRSIQAERIDVALFKKRRSFPVLPATRNADEGRVEFFAFREVSVAARRPIGAGSDFSVNTVFSLNNRYF